MPHENVIMEANASKVVQATHGRIRSLFRRTVRSIRTRLIACFVVIVLLMIAADVVAILQLTQIVSVGERLGKLDDTSLAVVRVHFDVASFRDRVDALADNHDTRQWTNETMRIRQKFVQDVDHAEQMLRATPDVEQDAPISSALESLRVTLLSQLDTAVQLATAGEWNAVQRRLAIQIPAVIEFSSMLVDKVDQQALQQRSKAVEDAHKARQRLFIIVPIAALLTLLAAAVLGWYVTWTITSPLSVLTAGAEALARGDFRHRVNFHGDDELAILGNAFNYAARELQQLYEDLRGKEQELRDVINTVPAHAWSALPDGNVDFVNQRWRQFTGLPAEDALGRNWEAVLHPDDRAKFVAGWRAALNNGQPMETEVRVRRVDGEYRCLLVRNVPMRDDLGNIVKWYGTGLDIEDRKRAEEKVHATMTERARLAAFREEIGIALSREKLLKEILQNCGQAMVRHLDAAFARIWTLSSDGGELQLQASAGMYTRLDGSHSRIPFGHMKIGLIAQERKPHLTNDVQNDPQVTDKDWARREKMISFAGYPLFVEDRVVGVMGMFSAKPLTESTLEALSFAAAGIAQGIERKKTEEALRRSEAYLLESQRLTRTSSWVWLVEGRKVVYLSEEWYRVYGFDPTDGIPTWEKRLERVHPEDRAKWEGTIERAILEKADYDMEFRIVLADGTVKWIHTVGHPILTGVGDLVQFLGSSTDITERKCAEAERERFRQLEADLARMNRVSMMGELAAALAHEIKQPIAAAVTNANTSLRWLARDVPDLQEARQAIIRTAKEGTRAAEIVNRLRSFYMKGAPPHPELVDLNEVAREIVMLLRDEAHRYSIAMRTELAPELPKANTDRVQLQQVFMNLMLNAIEAMKETAGELAIKSQLSDDGQLLISVSDTGVGLPAEKPEQIFEAFYTTKSQGTGMGLAITRSIIEAHGGRLWASANPGGGATFHFILPSEAAASSTSAD